MIRDLIIYPPDPLLINPTMVLAVFGEDTSLACLKSLVRMFKPMCGRAEQFVEYNWGMTTEKNEMGS